MSYSASNELDSSKDDAYRIIRAYDDEFGDLVSLSKSLNLSSQISDDSRTETYASVYTKATSSESSGGQVKTIITTGSTHALNTISSLHKLISNGNEQERVPLPALLKRDDSKKIIASPYALYALPPGETFSSFYSSSFLSSHALSATPAQEEKGEDDASRTRARLRAELQLGSIFKTLHLVQNDWFGLPGDAKEWEECYSWQVCFTQLLEEALLRLGELEKNLHSLPSVHPESERPLENAKERIPIEDIHRLLARAISFFLFDDVEVPSLVLTPSFAWSQRIFVDPSVGEITALLTLLAPGGSIWGDPMLEGVFHPHLSSGVLSSGPLSTEQEQRDEWPSKVFYEAYPNPFVFPRQRTKRLWYDLYVSLLRLAHISSFDSRDAKGEGNVDGGSGVMGEGGDGEERGGDKEEKDKKERIRIREIVQQLENAPCY